MTNCGENGGDKLRVCFFQCYYTDYIRSQALLEGLYQNRINIVPCIVNRKSPVRYFLAIRELLAVLKGVDVIIANFRCWEILPVLRLITKQPIIYDAHISIWQTYCEERKKCAPYSLIGRLLYYIDKYNCNIANIIMIDTISHARYFSQTFRIPEKRLLPVYISCESSRFRPIDGASHRDNSVTKVFWAGSGIPLQGLEFVIDAMKLLREQPIHLRLAGSSRIIDRMKLRAGDGKNITFIGRVPRETVVEEIDSADICLGGHYSGMSKAKNVIAGKLYEMIAMRKPVIAGDSAAVRELFTDGENILLCEMGSARALAEAILLLHNNPGLCASIASNAYNLYNTRLQPKETTLPLVDAIRSFAIQRTEDYR